MTTPRDPDLDTRDLLHQDVLRPTDRADGVLPRTPAAMGVSLLVLLAVIALITLFMILGVTARPG